MMKVLMKGNEAIAEAAIRAGCEAYFGYPITPQTEVLEYMSRRMPELGRAFVQAESELAAINMVYGAACTGARVMTTTSSPGYSLMQEGISYIAMSFVPCVVVNIMRGGPGLGNIQPAQGDYFQMTKGGGHGDYHLIVLAPATVQETIDLIVEAFDLADKYRQPVTVIADGMIGQIMEPVEFPELKEPERPERPWALTGAKGREKNIITSLFLGAENLERENFRLQEIITRIVANEVRYDEYMLDGAEIVVVAYGTAGRIVQTAVKQARAEGIAAGLFRPISMFPFPYDRLREVAGTAKHILDVELSAGQMIEDVRLATRDALPISFFGKMGGVVPLPDQVLTEIQKIAGQ
ncbi:MAG TPA: 3-methyl-2-oxobutanoate dehydrogenase subunit VorB [Anaerolineae bacterium]|nr:3-methyl-2-oxobutanoate dehydrogenase subunit VorB [Anaerolineae bacterium]